MASALHLKGIEQTLLGNIAFESDTFQLHYMDVSYTPAPTTENFWSDTSANEASGTPTETLASPDVRIDTGNSRVEVDWADVTEPSITASTNKFQIIKWTGVAATSPIIGTFDIVEGTLSPVSGTLSLTFNAEGVFSISTT